MVQFPVGAQRLDGLFGKRQPVTGGLQFRWRQVERFLAQVLATQPRPLAESCHLRGDLQFAVSLGAAFPAPMRRWTGSAVQGCQQAHLGLAQRLGEVVERHRDERGSVAGQVEVLDEILLTFVQVDGARVHHPGCGGQVHFAEDARRLTILDVQEHVFGRGRAQRDGRGRVGVRHPEIFVTRKMQFLVADQEIKDTP